MDDRSAGGGHKRPRAEAECADTEDDGFKDDGVSPVRRGIRASYFRKSTPNPKSLSGLDNDGRPAHASPCPSRSGSEREPLEVLLTASEEGDLDAVVDFLKRPDAKLLINMHGFARMRAGNKLPGARGIEGAAAVVTPRLPRRSRRSGTAQARAVSLTEQTSTEQRCL